MKRLICMLIAVLMICSITPCVFAETVEDYIFYEFDSADKIHKWGASWNDYFLYYTEEDAANYPDSYKEKTINFTIDGVGTTLYAKYIVTADTEITRNNCDYSLKWDKIGKKAAGGAYRDSDETNNRIESHGKKCLYDDRLSVKLLRTNIGNKNTEFNPETMMQNNTLTADATKYGYVNLWMYSSAETNSNFYVDLYFSRTLNATLEDKLNYRSSVIPDWTGWKLISIPVEKFDAKAGDKTYPTYVNNVGFSIIQAEADKLPSGYHVNFDSMWLSQELPEGATDITDGETPEEFSVFDIGSSEDNSFLKNWANSWNHVNGGLTATTHTSSFVYVWAAETEKARSGKNYALRWDNIDKNGLAQSPGDYWINETSKRTVARNELKWVGTKNAKAWELDSYGYLNLWVYSDKKTKDKVKLALTNYTDAESRVEKYNVNIPVGWENEWILLSIAKNEILTKDGTANLETNPDEAINCLSFKISEPSADTVLLFDSMYFSKEKPEGAKTISDITPEPEPEPEPEPTPDEEEEISNEYIIADFTDGTDYGFKSISVTNYEGFSVSGGIDSTKFEFPTYKWEMSKAVATGTATPTSRFYLNKDYDLSAYKDGYLNMRIYSTEATGKKFVVVFGASAPRNTGSGTTDYRTSSGSANLTIDWVGWKNVSLKLGTKSNSSDANTLSPTYYSAEPEKGYYSDIKSFQMQNGGYYTYDTESPAQTLYIESIWVAKEPALDDVVVSGWESEKLITSDMAKTEYSDVSVTDNTVFAVCKNTFSNAVMASNVSEGLIEVTKNGTPLTEGWTAKASGTKIKITFDNKLDFASKYEIVLKAGLKANHGATLKENKTLILNTQIEAPVLDSINIYEGTAKIDDLSAYNGGELKIEANVSGVNETAKAIFITCVYDGATNEMLAMFTDNTCENGKFTNSVAGYNDFNGKYINCFMWNTLEGMQILSGSKIIK
ncbi:MAG: hypothetical protein IJC74_06705 [Clostridia bacterium]|nr:hypothetical protein [Clostridia bacterium]